MMMMMSDRRRRTQSDGCNRNIINDRQVCNDRIVWHGRPVRTRNLPYKRQVTVIGLHRNK